MRVVCDNCGAVYKISEAKLVKDVNRATCKRCGHKILIAKPGASSPAEAATKAQHGGSEQDQVVVKSSPDLPSAPQPSVPSIGSLTAELRAITIPGIDSVGGAGGGVARLGPTSEPDSDLTQRRDLGAPAVAPATGIPASNSPATMAYRGPAPAVSGGAVTAPAAPQGPAAAAQPSIPTGSAGVVSARHQDGRGSGADTRPVGQVVSRPSTSQASPVFSNLNFCASIGLLGLIASLFLSGTAALAAVGVAGFGLCSALALSLATAGGTKLARVPLSIGVGVIGGIVVAGLGAIAPTDSAAPAPAPTAPAPAPAPEPVQAVAAANVEQPAATPEESAGESETQADPGDAAGEELSAAELEEARSFEKQPVERESDSIAANATKASKADVDPAAAARKEEAARKREEGRRAEAAKRAEKKRDDAAKREEAAQREAERKRDESRATGLGGPRRASLKKPDAGSPTEKKSSGPKPFVIDTIIRNNGNIKRCLEAERGRGQDLSGKIFLQFTISPDGGVSRAKLTTSRWAGTSLDSCISKQVNRLEFPPFDGNAKKIKYALVIQ